MQKYKPRYRVKYMRFAPATAYLSALYFAGMLGKYDVTIIKRGELLTDHLYQIVIRIN